MNVSVLINTHGDPSWHQRAMSHAYPSARKQAPTSAHHLLDGTLAQARNQAAQATTTTWLCFLDADDQLAPGYIEAMRKALTRHQNCEASGAGGARRNRGRARLLVPAVQYVTPEGMPLGEPAIPNRNRWPVLNECVIGTLVPRELFLHVGGFRELRSLEDWDLWLRCWDAGAELVYVPDAVYIASVRPEGRNSDQSTYNEVWAQHRLRAQGGGGLYQPVAG